MLRLFFSPAEHQRSVLKTEAMIETELDVIWRTYVAARRH